MSMYVMESERMIFAFASIEWNTVGKKFTLHSLFACLLVLFCRVTSSGQTAQHSAVNSFGSNNGQTDYLVNIINHTTIYIIDPSLHFILSLDFILLTSDIISRVVYLPS
jgi:hypothetical protein